MENVGEWSPKYATKVIRNDKMSKFNWISILEIFFLLVWENLIFPFFFIVLKCHNYMCLDVDGPLY